MKYPKHLSEKIREEVAVNYLKHELKKIFPSIKSQEVENLMNCSQLCNPRDFWNGVHGVGMGFKLHIGFIYLLTAENIEWTRENIRIDELHFGVDREITKNCNTKSVKEIIGLQQANIKPIDIGKWDYDPILVVEKNTRLSVYEGNNRLEKFISNGIQKIEAYVGRYKTEIKKPINYWLPTSVLMDILFYVYQAIDSQNDELFCQQIAVIKNMLSFSESGKMEFRERALTTKEPYKSKIMGKLDNLYTK